MTARRALFGALALILALPAAAAAQGERVQHVVISGYAATCGVDLSITMYGIGAGHFREANPALRWAQDKPVRMSVVKMSSCVAVSALLVRSHRTQPKAALITGLALIALNTWVVHRNTKLLPERHR